ncbi:MAG: hypothetical protein AAFR29_04450 [Pseudomonadota bacterium]
MSTPDHFTARPLKNVALSAVTAAFVCCAGGTLAVPAAQAASTDAMVDMCIEEMDARAIAKKDVYRTKLKKIRGGGLKRLTLQVMPLTKEGTKMVVECKVRGSAVVDLIVK